MEMENEDAQDHTKRLQRDLLLAILGSLPAPAAVQASLLIPDWGSLWTEVPVMNLNSTLFGSFQAFENFVIGVFTHRNNELKLDKISYLNHAVEEQSHLRRRVIEHAVSSSTKEVSVDIMNVDDSNLQETREIRESRKSRRLMEMENEDAQDHTKRLQRDLLLAILGSSCPRCGSSKFAHPGLGIAQDRGVFTHRNNELKLDKISYLNHAVEEQSHLRRRVIEHAVSSSTKEVSVDIMNGESWFSGAFEEPLNNTIETPKLHNFICDFETSIFTKLTALALVDCHMFEDFSDYFPCLKYLDVQFLPEENTEFKLTAPELVKVMIHGPLPAAQSEISSAKLEHISLEILLRNHEAGALNLSLTHSAR
ncbi:hypothetical protein LINPERPRIM_LOCUS36046 [Linum perenne]